jgi:hypothetical protein
MEPSSAEPDEIWRAGKTPNRLDHSPLNPKPKMGTNTPKASVLPALPSVEPRMIAPINPITAWVVRQPFMTNMTRRGAAPPANPNNPATEISSDRLRCTAEK